MTVVPGGRLCRRQAADEYFSRNRCRADAAWFIGIARAVGNLIGNCGATVVIGAWEHELDMTTAKHVLDGETTADLTAG